MATLASMDVPRSDSHRTQRKRRMTVAAVIVAVAALAVAAVRVTPAVPTVPRSSIWTGKVVRGPMLREVRGSGKLVPVEVRWITAQGDARVERVNVEAGARVGPSSVLLQLSNPEVEQRALDAELALRSAREELTIRRIDSESQLLAQNAVAAGVAGEADEAQRLLEVQESLAREGLTPNVTLAVAGTRAKALAERAQLERERVEGARRMTQAQRSAAASRIAQLKTAAALRALERDALQVRAGIGGIVQLVPVQPGQQVAPGTVLAKVAVPDGLKAELGIPETLARDLQPGQSAVIDTRNGRVRGTVQRIDPASENGMVTVDVALPAVLPKGARPDLSVDGIIEIERIPDTLWLPRPIQADGDGTLALFKVLSSGEAVRVPVRAGRTSANAIEILGGLQAGDEVILSDTSAWSNRPRVKIE